MELNLGRIDLWILNLNLPSIPIKICLLELEMFKKYLTSKIIRSSILLLNSRLCSILSKTCRMYKTLWEILIRCPKIRFQFKRPSTTILNPTVFIPPKWCTINQSLSISSSNIIPNSNLLPLLRPNRYSLNNYWIISYIQHPQPNLLNHRTP